MNEEASDNKPLRDEHGRLLPGHTANPNGRKPDTEQDKIVKKATKQLIEEYKEALGESLELIRPALIEKAMNGDISAIKEINDRVMGKANQNLDVTTAGESLNTALVRFIDGK